MAALDGERFGEQFALVEVVRQQNAPRTRLVVIELGQERIEHFAGQERAVGAGKIGAVAPVLAGAEEKHFDAGEAAVLVGGEYIGLFDAARIDALARLDRRQRGEPVAQRGGALEIERFGGAVHLVARVPP